MKKLTLFIFSGLIFNGLMAQYQQPLSGTPAKSFTSLPSNSGFLVNSVNQFTGQVQFSMPVMTISGKSGLSLGVAFNYSSLVRTAATTWNREAPTSVLGLGWSMDLPRIIADHKGTVHRDDDDFYISGGGANSQLIYDGMDGSEWKFYMKNYQFWKIRYNPSTESWTVTKEDGTKYVYGSSVIRKCIQYVVGWGNWIGNSSLSSGGVQVAYIWDLSEVIDIWGDNITLEYSHDIEGMGGTTHTRASYLAEIKNSIGERVNLVYQSKQYNTTLPGPREYQDPHAEGYESDGYQEKYENRYLDKVVSYNENSELLGEVRLGYQFVGSDELTKRQLRSITTVAATGT